MSPPNSRLRGGLAGLALVLASVLVGAALAELIFPRVLPLRFLRAHYQHARDIFQSDPARVVYDPELGFLPRPGLDVVFENPERGGFRTRVRTNAWGLRDDASSLVDPRAVFLGDSFAFGWGVEGSETLEARFEQRTGRRSLNAGVPGYGTVQALLLLRRLAGEADLAGSLVVLVLYGNDLTDNVGYGFGLYPRVASFEPELDFTRAPPEAFETWLAAVRAARPFDRALFRRSRVAYAVGRGLRALGLVASREDDPRGPEASEEEKLALLTRLLGSLHAEVRRRGASPFAVYVPRITHVTGEKPGSYEAFRDAFDASGIPHLDATRVLEASDYWPLDGHWRASGHEKVARALVRAAAEERPGT